MSLSATTKHFRSVEDLVAQRDRVFGKGAPLFYSEPLHLVRGEGVWLFDNQNRPYLDMYNNIPVVGHCNSRVVEAMSRQAALHSTHTRYLDENILDFAENLLNLHHDQISSVIFACSGTEANEIAMQMARIATGGRGFICTDAAYHGNSQLVSSLTRAPHRGRTDIHSIPFPQCYRPPHLGLSESELEDFYVAEVQSAIDDFAKDGVPFAGMLMCPILANEGLPTIPSDFFRRSADLVRAAGGLVIMDEVQAGYCRSGHWWGYQRAGVIPDIVTMGKPMGNGFPLSACAARPDLVELFRDRVRYFNTFAGSPTQAVVGQAVLDEIKSRDLLAHVNDVGEYLVRSLRDLTDSVDQVGEVRGCGLFVGLEWVSNRENKEPDRLGAIKIVDGLKERGILVSNAGPFGNVLKLRPPLVFERQHADLFLEAFEQTMEENYV